MIPRELIDNAQWCVWKSELRGDRRTKVPYDPQTGKRAEANNPETFRSYAMAEEEFRIEPEYNGVGIRVANGFSAVDIDHCVEAGELSDFAKGICEHMNSYTEFSPSKTGLRIIFKGDNLQYDKTKYYLKNPKNGVEIYVSDMTNRFMTITGNTLLDRPIRAVTLEELTVFLEKYMRRQTSSVPDRLSDDQIIAKASQNEKFRALFAGDTTAYNNDHSSADLALCNILAFWTGKDEAQMDRIFRRSGLYRDKWERSDYRTNTIQHAVSQCTTTYDPVSARKIWDRLDTPAYETGAWTVDNSGVHRDITVRKKQETIYAVSTPLAPAAYLENLDDGIHKVELHYIYNGTQRSVLCDRETIASRNKIVALANHGINVTSNDAAELVRYLSDIERLNPVAVRHYKSISRLGWVGNDFVPYDSRIKFDGDAENRALFQAVSKSGGYREWVEFMRPLRRNNSLRLMMAASFASPLIERVNALPFVFHLWGKTGKGKTVALMVAMSIWGDPRPGKLMRTMNMTNAAMMSTAVFLNNLPFAGDELQTIRDKDGSYDKLIMQITEGVDRGRMQYSKNLPTNPWKCSFLFTGEEPCTSSSSGGGAKNRVFEVNFTDAIVDNGAEVVRFITKNHGHAGAEFIKHVAGLELAADYDKLVEEIRETCNTTDKQAAVGALVLLADKLASEYIFTGEEALGVLDIAAILKSDEEVSTSKRAYDYIVEWIAANSEQFNGTSYKETWGAWQGRSVFIINSILSETLAEKGFSFDAVKRDWADNGWLVKYRDKYKKRKSINGTAPYCVEIVLPSSEQ